MTAAHLTEKEYAEIEERKNRDNPKATVQYDQPIGPENPHAGVNAHQYSEDPGPKNPHAGVKADQYAEPAGPKPPSALQKHLTDGANRFIFGTTNKTRAAHVVSGINVLNSTVGQNVGRSPASTPPWAIGMPYQGRGGVNPLFVSPYSPYAARPAPKKKEARREQRSGGMPGWVLGTAPAPWLNNHGKAATAPKKKSGKSSRQPRHWSGF